MRYNRSMPQRNERPKFDRPSADESLSRANDNERLSTHDASATANENERLPEAANDNGPKGHLREIHQEVKEARQNPGGSVGDIISEIERAPKGAIIFTRGITAKHDHADAHATMESRREAKGYMGGVKEFYADNEDVVVISGEELLHEGAGAHGGSMDSTIKTLERKYGDKTLVIDAQPKLDELFFKPWEKLGDSITGVMNKKGAAGEAWLKEWLRGQHSGQAPKEGEPTLDEVLKAFHGSWQALQSFRASHLGNRQFSIGLDADNPLELAFLAFCETGRLDPEAVDFTLSFSKREKNRIGFVHVLNDNTVQTSLGQGQAHTRRMAA